MQEVRDIASIAYESPGWTFIYFVLVALFTSYVTGELFDFASRLLTTLNILIRGWPPEHLDGAGTYLGDFEGEELGEDLSPEENASDTKA